MSSFAQIRPVQHTTRLAICYKNFDANRGLSHIGLGVAAMQNARALRALGYIVEIWPILSGADLAQQLAADRETARLPHHVPVTHVVISAPWIPVAQLASIVRQYSATQF